MHSQFVSYLDQLTRLAARRKVALRQAVLRAGVPDSTYHRWMHGKSRPSEAVARKVYGVLQNWSRGDGSAS